MKKAIFLAITLLIMGAIFYFSAQPGDASSELSNEVAVDVEDSIFAGLVPVIFSENMNANIRKWAHILVYFALGASMTATVFAFHETGGGATSRRRACIILASGICLLYAASDEIHQLFVPGRAGMVADVFLDMAGVLPGVLLAALPAVHKMKKHNNN